MATGKRGVLSSLLGLHSELERMIHDVVGGGAHVGPSRTWVPPADVFVCGGDIIVRFELAGVRLEDIDLSYHEGMLHVKGVRLDHEDRQKDGYWQMEIPHGSFERRVSIPVPVDADRVEATCRDGILEVRMPVVADKRAADKVRINADG